MGMVEIHRTGGTGRKVLQRSDITYNGASGMVITLPDGLTFGDIDKMSAICRDSSGYVIGAAKYSETQIIRHYSSEYSPTTLKVVAASATSFDIAQTSGACSLQEILILIKE